MFKFLCYGTILSVHSLALIENEINYLSYKLFDKAMPHKL
jgi:hypothetical protein